MVLKAVKLKIRFRPLSLQSGTCTRILQGTVATAGTMSTSLMFQFLAGIIREISILLIYGSSLKIWQNVGDLLQAYSMIWQDRSAITFATLSKPVTLMGLMISIATVTAVT